ncbi:MAG: COQ9 family protein, partial [Pseudomonadota bacterium]
LAFHHIGVRKAAEHAHRPLLKIKLGGEGDMARLEAVRRGATLFSLPHHAAEGTKLMWGTADAIWNALGDTSDDFNWYSKRTILSGVYYSTLLYWLGDDSLDGQATWSFLGRRIDDVMTIEKVKGHVNDNPLLRTAFAGPRWLASMIKAPQKADLPGGG